MSRFRRPGRAGIAWGTAMMIVLSSASCGSSPQPGGDGAGRGQQLSPFAVVATVNGDPVTAGELRREMARGSGPTETIRSRALKSLAEIKVQQALFRAKGIARDTGYAESLRQWEQENERRANAHQAGQPVYGPVTFEEDQYFRYRFDTDVAQLKERLTGHELPADDGRLRKYFEAVKGRFFSKGADLTLDVITSPYARPGETIDPVKRRDAETLIRTTETKVRGGDAPGDAARSAGLTVRRVRVTTGRAGVSRMETDAIAAIGSPLPAGGTASVTDLGSEFVIVRCVARKALGHTSFEHSRDQVRVLYLDQEYRHFVRRLADRAKLEVDQSGYAQVQRSST